MLRTSSKSADVFCTRLLVLVHPGAGADRRRALGLSVSFDPFGLGAIRAQLQAILNALDKLYGKVNFMAGELDALKAAVAHNTDVEESAIALLQGLKAKLDAAIAAGDPAALQALSDTLGAETDKLAAAVTANTPAA